MSNTQMFHCSKISTQQQEALGGAFSSKAWIPSCVLLGTSANVSNDDGGIQAFFVKQAMDSGFVYVLSNPAYPGLYKIGMTKNAPSKRARELSSATGVPSHFKVECYFEFEYPALVERQLHEFLSHKRFSGNREFFGADALEILDWLEDRDEALSYWFNDTFAEARYLRAIGQYHPAPVVVEMATPLQ